MPRIARIGLSAAVLTTALLTGAEASRAGISGAAEDRFVPGELLVRFKPGAGRGARAEALQEEGARRKRWLPVAGLELVTLPDGVSVAAAAREFEAKPDVLYAEPNFMYRASATPNDPRYAAAELWALHQASDVDIDAPEAWDVTQGSPDVVVAVVDTGVAYDHPDLAPNMWTNPGEAVDGIDNDGNGKVDDVRGWDFFGDGTTPDNNPRDFGGHGTHVAGTIGARGNDGLGVTGVNWNVKLMPVRVLGPSGGTNATVTEGFAYAAAEGARVVNASLGGAGYSQSMKAAIDAAANTLFVVAAGNDAANNEVEPAYPCNYASANLVCVAATTRTDALADFSNYGRTSVDVGAPGTQIVSTWPAYDAVFTDGFEDPLRWTAGGMPNTWTATSVRKLDGMKSGTDSPLGPYSNDSANWFRTTNAINLSGRTGCLAEYAMALQTEPGFDFLWIDGSTNAVSWSPLDLWTGQTRNFPNSWFTVDTPVVDFDGAASFYLRFRLDSDETEAFDGVYLDRFAIKCLSATFDPTDYNEIQGTSMASPHVAGVAALAWAAAPAATVDQVRTALLAGGDPTVSLAATTVTGRRVNAAVTLSALRGPARQLTVAKEGTGVGTVTSSPAGIDCGTVCTAPLPNGVTVVLTATAAPGSSFTGWSGACSGLGPCLVTLDGAKTLGATFEALPQAPPPPPPSPAPPPSPPPPAERQPQPQPGTPAPARCVVPTVRGKTVPAARRALAGSRCVLGRVSRAYSRRVRRGRIISQSRRPGARLARRTRVNVVVSRGRRR